MKDAEDEAFEAIEKAQGWRKRQITEQKEKPMTEREALKLALVALEEIAWSNSTDWQRDRAKVVIPAIKEALAHPEQEPVIGTKTWFEDGKVVTQHLTAKDIYKDPEQPEQEPVAWSDSVAGATDSTTGFYPVDGGSIPPRQTTPPQQERNFCPRCGKRLGKNDWDVHTCTPLQRKQFTLQELMYMWNSKADEYNQWDTLGHDEIVAFAQAAHGINEKNT